MKNPNYVKHYIKKFWAQNLLTIAVYTLNTMSGICASLLLMQILNSMVALDFNGALMYTLLNLGVWMVMLVLMYFKSVCLAKSVAKMNTALRSDISKNLINRPYTDYHKRDIGDYMSWYTSDLMQIENRGFTQFFNLIGSALQLIMSMCTLFYFHWSLGALTGVLAVILLFFPRLFNRVITKSGAKLSAEQEHFSGGVKDNLSGLDIMKSFGVGARFIKSMGSASENIENSKVAFVRTQGSCEGVMSFANVVSQSCTNLLIIALSIGGLIPIGTILGGGNLVGMTFNALISISTQSLSITASSAFFNKFELKSAEPSQLKQPLAQISQNITLKDLSFSYGEKQVLNNLNLSFCTGKKYALIGESGSGKSTVLKIILGMLTDYTGSVLFDGADALGYDTSSYHEHIAYIGQDVFLFNDTVRENITLGHSFSDEEIRLAVRDSALEHDLQGMSAGLNTSVGEGGCNLSGGQKQRIAIARALIHKRKILLVDEGTSALDKANADIVEDGLLKNPELTLILVSHHLDSKKIPLFEHVYSFSNNSAI